MIGVIIKAETKMVNYSPVKMTVSSIEHYFKGKERMYYLEHLIKENSKVMCYMLNDESENYVENKLNDVMSGLLGVAIYGYVLLVDWEKKISEKNYEKMINYLKNLDKKEYYEGKLKEFEELMIKGGYKIEYV